jgi:hypothetical protein
VAALLGLSACGDSIVLPEEGLPSDIEVFAGDDQIGAVGSALGDAIVVKVTDSRGRPVVNQQVSFTILTGDGQVVPATDDTDSDGLASVSWTLGPSAGAQSVRAQVTGNGAPSGLTADFSATALAGSGSTLVMVSGDGQGGPVGAALAEPLVVRVVDPLGNPVSGQTVTWTSIGGGTVDPASSVTGANGESSTQRTLGPSAGEQSTQAAAEGLAGSPVTFTHIAGASAPTRLELVSGNGQSAPSGFALPESLVVRLVDVNGNGVPGRTITWVVQAGGGVAAPGNSQTNAEGLAFTRWTLGGSVGTFTLNAVFSGLTSVPFSATATADAPSTIALLSGDGQSGAGGTALAAPLRVKITDNNGNPVENVSVTWTANGGGSVSATTTGSDAQGIAQVTRTLGATPGTYTTTAAVNGLAGSPITFTSTATVGAPARLAFLTQPTSGVVGETMSFQVEVQDAQGNRVTGATNEVRISPSPFTGTLSGDNRENAVAGVATFSGLSLREAHTGYTLIAGASGLTDATSDAFDIAPGATGVVITGRTPSTSVTGQAVTFNFNVDPVAPAAGVLSGSVTVTDGVNSNTCGTNDAGVGSCSIPLALAGTHTVTATYVDDPNFAGSTSPGFSVTVGKANATVVITADDPDPSAQGATVPVAFSVTGSSSGAAPAGTVTISASGTESCSADVAAGACDLTLTTLGNRTLTATYSGDDNYNGDTDTESHSVRLASATALGSSLNPSDAGQSVTFTATVTSGGGTPSGTVQFTVDGVTVGSDGLNGSGQATFTTSALTQGSHQIGARYLGSATFAASTATELTQVVNAGNAAPNAVDDPGYTVDEDQALSVGVAQGVLANDTDDGSLTASVVDGPDHAASFTLNPDGSFSYTPEADFFGTDQFVYQASDGSLTDQATATITVNAVNDAPSFTAGGDQSVSSFLASLTGVSVPGWAQNVSPGPNETGQTVTFDVSTDNDAAFITLPAVSSSGTLTYQPAAQGGTVVVTVTVVAQDSGGLSSAAQQFTITLNP